MRIETKLIQIDSARPNEVYRSRHSEIDRIRFVNDLGDTLKSDNGSRKPEITKMAIA